MGKSTLFNRLTKTRDALVADFPGLTRDRKYGRALYEDREYVLIDTGGIADDNTEQPEELTRMMTSQALQAIEESDFVLYLVDAKAGIMPGDYEVAAYIRRARKPCVVVANKIDGLDPQSAGSEFYSLGLGEVYPIAAVHGRGVNKLLQEVIAPLILKDAQNLQHQSVPAEQPEGQSGDPEAKLGEAVLDNAQWESSYGFLDAVPTDKEGGGFDWYAFRQSQRERGKSEELPAEEAAEPYASLPLKFAIVGKPNVGKSTLTNRLLGEERVIVADFPGTTRDAIYIPLERNGRHYIVIDTAGVRKRRKVSAAIEKFSIVKTLKAIEDCNVALLLIDARAHISDQDLSLLSFILDSGRALVVAVNKWDGLDPAVKDEIREELNSRLGFVDFARVHFISALHGTGVGNLYDSIDEAYASATQRHSSNELNRILRQAVSEHEPPVSGGRRIKLKFAHPGGYNPPRIIIHGNKVSKVPDAYHRYIVNCFRKALNIVGSPLLVEFKEGENPYAQVKPAQQRQTQSQRRAQQREEQTQRRYRHAAQKAQRKVERAKKEALREGKGLVLPKKSKTAT